MAKRNDDWGTASRSTICRRLNKLDHRAYYFYSFAACGTLGAIADRREFKEWIDASRRMLDINDDESRVDYIIDMQELSVRISSLLSLTKNANSTIEGYQYSWEALQNLVFPSFRTVNQHVIAYRVKVFGQSVPEIKRELQAIYSEIAPPPNRGSKFSAPWRTPTVMGIVQAIYATEEFWRMPILADALEEAGCDNDTILTHCRSETKHVRGCWVCDLVLGFR